MDMNLKILEIGVKKPIVKIEVFIFKDIFLQNTLGSRNAVETNEIYNLKSTV